MMIRKMALVAAFLVSTGCGKSPDSKKDEGGSDGDEVIECTTTAECPDGGICRDEKCVIRSTCESSDDCGINSECHPEKGVCVECLAGAHCAPGQTCLSNVCRDSCEASEDCEGALRCAENGYCAECLADDDCATDEHCQQGSCQPDVCRARSTACTEDGNVKVCSERGDSTAVLDCPKSETCGIEQGPAWCQSWICTPDQSFCAEGENVAITCSSDGLTYAGKDDCTESDTLCDAGECKPYICDPFTNYCKEGHVYTCDSLGISDTLYDVCSTSEYCDEDLATCRPKLCTPGALGCQSGEVGTCNELGSGYEDLTPCDEDEVCDFGDCQPIICSAGQRFCEDGNVHLCNSTGTFSNLYDTCTAGEFCNDSGSFATCSTDVCTPEAPACDGDTLGTCAADGSGIESDGTTDCTQDEQVCHGGACKPTICTVPARLCVSGDVHQCIDKGTATQLYDDCNASEYCDEETATCKPHICTPTEPGCDGDIARTCNADGSGWESGGTDCSTLTDKACDAGSCKDIICPAGGRYCEGTQVMTCNALGTGGTLYQSCTTNYHCYESGPTSAYCRFDVCTANAAVCDGETATVCASDGSARLPGGTDCTESGQACYSGNCADVVCGGSYECVDGNFHRCVNNRTATTLYDTCTATEYCHESLGCRPQVCTPSAVTCSGNVGLRTCNSDGSGYTDTPCGGTDRCWDGECRAELCENEETLCLDGDFHICEENGTASSLLNDCVEAQYCDATDGCLPDVCTANMPTCNGDLVTTCNSDGSAPLPGGTDCSSEGEACHDATCMPIVCNDGEFTCDGQELSECVNNGTSIAVVDNCTTGTHCNEDAGLCLIDACSPGATACLDFDTVVTCSSDGAGYDAPGTDCTAGDICDEGACVGEASTCTIDGKTWGSETKIAASYSSSFLTQVGADLSGNVFAAWINADGLYAAHYVAESGPWTVELVDENADAIGEPALGVSADGHAVIVYSALNEFNYEVDAIHFDPGTRSWSEPVVLLNEHIGVPMYAADGTTDGRVGVVICDYVGVWGTGFNEDSGWLAPTFLAGDDPYSGTCAIDATPSGKAVATWIEAGSTAADGNKWSTFDYGTGVWSPTQLVGGNWHDSLYAAVDVISMNDDATDLWFVYQQEVDFSSELRVRRWTSMTGLGSATTIATDAFSDDAKFVKAPGGDLYLFVNGAGAARLPSGSSTWVSESGNGPTGGAFAYPSGDLILNNGSGTFRHFINGTGWSSQSYTSSSGEFVALPGCGGAWVYRWGTSGTYVRWLQ